MRTGQARKRDANENGIVEALEAVGAKVLRVSGKGLPDLFVCYRGKWKALEVKSATGRLTDAQAWHEDYSVWIVQSADEALKAIGCDVGAR